VKTVEAQGPVSLAMEKVSEVIAILHDLIDEELRKAPDTLKVQATDALSATKILMNALLEHMKGHAKVESNVKHENVDEATIAFLEKQGKFVLADKIRSLGKND